MALIDAALLGCEAPGQRNKLTNMGLSGRRLSSRKYGLFQPMETRAILGWNLRRLRVEKGLSQERLAFAAGLDRAYVGRIERGSENVTVTSLDMMAKVLEVPVAELFREPSKDEPRPAPLKAGRKSQST